MTQTLKDWPRPQHTAPTRHTSRRLRRNLLCLPLFAACWAVPAATVSAQDKPADDKAAADAAVDPGTKKLTAAHGLFQRSLFKLAAQQYEEFLQQYPQHAELTTARYALAVCRYRLGEYEPAVKLLGQVLADPKFEQRDEALAVLGHSHLAGNKYDQALVALDELLAKHPQSKHAETAALNRAQVLYLADKKPQALEAAQAFTQKFPQSAELPTAMYFLALAQHDLEKPADAAKTLAALLEKHPDTRYALDATLLLGQSLESTGDLAGAAKQYEKMLTDAPATRKADAQYSLGAVLYKAEKYDDAIVHLSAVLKDAAQSDYAAPARLQLGLVQLAAGKTAEARQTLTEVAQKDPPRANDAKYGLAQCDIADKKFEAARATLDQLAQAQPAPANLPQILLDRAVCLMELNQHEPAAKEFAAFVQKHPQSPQVPEALYRQAFCVHKLGKFDESHALAQQVAKLPESPFTAPTAELDAENLFLLGKYADAAKAFTALTAAMKDADRALRFKLRLGQCAYFANDFAGTVKLLAPLAEDPKVAEAEDLHQAIFLLGDAQLQLGKNVEAAAALQKYIGVAKGDKLEAQFKLGLAQLRADQKDAAAATLAAVGGGPADSPWVPRALFERGQLLYKDGKAAQAAEPLAKVLTLNAPQELAAPALYLLGWVDFDAKKYPEAAARWAQLVEKYPKDKLAADASFQRGAALNLAAKHQEALAALQQYIKENPEGQHAGRAKQMAAASLTALERHDDAAAMLASLVTDSKNLSDTVLYDLAWSHRNKKDNAAAAAAYQQLIAKFPDSDLAPATKAELAEFLYADKKYKEAAAMLEEVAADKKAKPETLAAATYRLGWCYANLKQPEKAGQTLAAFAEKNPKNDLAASALLQAGMSYAEVGDLPNAQKALGAMLAAFPQHEKAPLALMRLGQIQSDAGNFEAALQSFGQFLQKYPQDKSAYAAHFGIGFAQESRKQYAPARASYEKVIALTNTETAARAQFQIGETYAAEGKFEQAVPALLAVEDVYDYPKWSAKALLEAGRVFEEMKQNDDAREQYGLLVQKYKEAPEAKAAQERLTALKSSAASAR